MLFFSVEQFRHGHQVPGIPLNQVTPVWLWGRALRTDLVAVVYAPAGVLLVIGKKTRAAATLTGLTVIFIVLLVYAPFAVAERASFAGFNFFCDTLMYCGAVLLLAGATPCAGSSRADDHMVTGLGE